MKKLILLYILLLLSIGFGITPIQHLIDIKNLHTNKLNDFLPFEDEDPQIRLGRMFVGDLNLLRYDGQIWEDLLWVNSWRYTYTYDENNNQIESLRQIWEDSEWVNDRREIYVYDENNNQIELKWQRWENSEWMNSSYRYIYTYDENNNQIESLRQAWENSEWVNSYRYTSTYDENNNQIESLTQIWENSEWVDSWRWTSTYDENNNQIESLTQIWENSEWVDSYRYTYTYDENNNQIESLRQAWENSEWVNSYRYTSTYDENNNQIEYLTQIWNGYEWAEYLRETYTYDANNNLIERILNPSPNLKLKIVLTYDENNNLVERLMYLFDEGSEWELVTKNYNFIYCEQGTQCYPYDSFGNCIATGDKLDENGLDCNGECGGNAVEDECGICNGDNLTCTGCMNDTACNYDIDATISGECEYAEENYNCDGSCTYAQQYYNCDGTCITDTDEDGVCDELEVVGCQDETACNYDETATDSGDCTHTDGVCESCVDGVIVDNDLDDDTVCDDMDVCEGYDDTLDSDGDGTPDGCDLSIYEGIIPDNFSIASIYPNPFNPVTSITYGLPENTDIQITVYDMGGTHIKTLENTFQTAGYHTISWNADNLPSGVYLIRMNSGDFTQTQKVVLVK